MPCSPQQGGGWIFIRAILDDELLETIEGMIYFQKWRQAITHKFKFMQVVVVAEVEIIDDGNCVLGAPSSWALLHQCPWVSHAHQ